MKKVNIAAMLMSLFVITSVVSANIIVGAKKEVEAGYSETKIR